MSKSSLMRKLFGDEPVVVPARAPRPARPVVARPEPVRLSKVERLERDLAAETDHGRKVTIGLKLQAALLQRDGAPTVTIDARRKLGAAVVAAPDGRDRSGRFTPHFAK
jgi:hypothetical protein